MNPFRDYRFEPLEMRTLLSSVHLQHNGLLHVIGAGGAANTIVVGLTADQQSIDVSVSYPATRHSTKVINETFPVANVHTMLIDGGSKGDYIAIDQTNGSFTVPTTIMAGGGNDTVLGGDEPDSIIGGNGNDCLSGGGGNDTLNGQAGHDTLLGGDGDDVLRDTGGHNSLNGGDGNDILYDPQGPDTMMGGSGNNAFFVYRLKGDPVNDYDAATDELRIVPPPNSGGSSFWDDVLDYYVL